MDNIGIANVGIASVAAITVICYLVGLIVKASGLNDKYIPICCGVAGAVLGWSGCIWGCRISRRRTPLPRWQSALSAALRPPASIRWRSS